MPFVTITLREGTSPEYRSAVSRGIHYAMIDILEIPEDDRFHVIHEQKPENMLQAPVAFSIPRSERCMFIQMIFNQRPAEQKQALFASIVEHLDRDPGVPANDIIINILEAGAPNWWADGRVVNPETGYDARMSASAVPASSTT